MPGNQRPSKTRSWVIWFLPAFFMFYQYGIQILPNLKMGYIHTHYAVNKVGISTLSVFYLLPYVLLQMVAGVLIDSFDAKKILTGAMLLFSFGTLLVYFSDQTYSYFLYAAGHVFMGAAACTSYTGAVYLAKLWLSNPSYKLAVSYTTMLAPLGVLIIAFIFNSLLIYLSWSSLIFINFIFCLVLAALFWYYIIDVPKSGQFQLKLITTNLKFVIKSKNMWFCALYVASASVHMVVLTNTWRIEILESYYHITQSRAILINGFNIVGYIVGAPLFGLLATKTQKLTLILMISAIIEFFLLLILHFTDTLTIKVGWYFFIGVFTSAQVLAFALVKDLVKESMLATGIGFVNMLEISLGMLLIPVIGKFLNIFPGNYRIATTVVVFASFFAVVMASCLWLSYTRKQT